MSNASYRYRFVVKEGGQGELSLIAEPMGGEPEELKNKIIGFYLPEDATMEQAREMAKYIYDKAQYLIISTMRTSLVGSSDAVH